MSSSILAVAVKSLSVLIVIWRDQKKSSPSTQLAHPPRLFQTTLYPIPILIMPSEKAMAKAAKIIKAPVNEKSTKKVADSDDETSSSGSSSSGSGSDDDDATSSSGSGSGSGSGSDSDSEEEDLPQHVTAPTYVSLLPYPPRRKC